MMISKKIRKQQIPRSESLELSREFMQFRANTRIVHSDEVISQDDFLKIILKEGAGLFELSKLFTFYRPVRKPHRMASRVLSLTDQQHDAMYALSGCRDVTYILSQVKKEVRSALLTVYNIDSGQILLWFKNRRYTPRSSQLQPNGCMHAHEPISGSCHAERLETNLLPFSGSLTPLAQGLIGDQALERQVSLVPNDGSQNRPDYGSLAGAVDTGMRFNSLASDIATIVNEPHDQKGFGQAFERAKSFAGKIEDQPSVPQLCQAIFSESDKLFCHSGRYFSLPEPVKSKSKRTPYISPHLYMNHDHQESFSKDEIDIIIAESLSAALTEKEQSQANTSSLFSLDQLAGRKSQQKIGAGSLYNCPANLSNIKCFAAAAHAQLSVHLPNGLYLEPFSTDPMAPALLPESHETDQFHHRTESLKRPLPHASLQQQLCGSDGLLGADGTLHQGSGLQFGFPFSWANRSSGFSEEHIFNTPSHGHDSLANQTQVWDMQRCTQGYRQSQGLAALQDPSATGQVQAAQHQLDHQLPSRPDLFDPQVFASMNQQHHNDNVTDNIDDFLEGLGEGGSMEVEFPFLSEGAPGTNRPSDCSEELAFNTSSHDFQVNQEQFDVKDWDMHMPTKVHW